MKSGQISSIDALQVELNETYRTFVLTCVENPNNWGVRLETGLLIDNKPVGTAR